MKKLEKNKINKCNQLKNYGKQRNQNNQIECLQLKLSVTK